VSTKAVSFVAGRTHSSHSLGALSHSAAPWRRAKGAMDRHPHDLISSRRRHNDMDFGERLWQWQEERDPARAVFAPVR